MTEEDERPKYIICSKCHCKYNNDELNLKRYFGYKRIGDRYKTCIKCRTRKPVISSSSSSTDTPPVIELPLKITTTSLCLKSCSNPLNGIHDMVCKNKGRKVYDTKFNSFLNEEEVIETCKRYGYKNIQLPKEGNVFMLEDDLEDVFYHLHDRKKICVFTYSDDCSYVVEEFTNMLYKYDYLEERVMSGNIIVCMLIDGRIKTVVMCNVNTFDSLFIECKLKHSRRCFCCLEKNKHRLNCFRCDKDICYDCFLKLDKLVCPHCNYNIIEHSLHMDNLYEVDYIKDQFYNYM
jgi:hypothetical protein